MDVIIVTALIAIAALIAFYVYILHERIILQQEQMDLLSWQLKCVSQRADRLDAAITAHLRAKHLLLNEISALERQNAFLRLRSGQVLRHKRSGNHHAICHHPFG